MRPFGLLDDLHDGCYNLCHGMTWAGNLRTRGTGLLPRPCDVCRTRTRGAHRFTLSKMVYTSLGDATFVHGRICEACWQRHLELEPAAKRHGEEKRRKQFEQRVRTYRTWLKKAPRDPNVELEPRQRNPFELTPYRGEDLVPVDRPGEPGPDELILEHSVWSPQHERWLLDLDVAARRLAMRSIGALHVAMDGPFLEQVTKVPDCGYTDALSLSWGSPHDTSDDQFDGTVYRVDDDKILIVWRFSHSFNPWD